jgi:hypothetical protein
MSSVSEQSQSTMNAADWQENNNRYLAASLEWLRLRLRKLAPPDAAANKSSAGVVLDTSTIDAAPQRAAAERDAAAQSTPPPALVLLAQRLGLTPFERDTLLLCAAAELDPAMAALCAEAQGSSARVFPTFSLALQALDQPSWDAVAAHRPLRYSRLIDIDQPGSTPLTASGLRIDERILNYLKGLNSLDERLASLAAPVPESATMLAPSQQNVAEQVLQRLRQAAAESVVPTIQLIGSDPSSKLAVARHVCAALNRRLYRVAVETLPPQRAEIETLTRLWQRESALLPVGLYIEAENLDGISVELSASFQWFLAREVGLVFVGLRDGPARIHSPHYAVEVSKPTAGEQRNAWLEILEPLEGAEHAARTAQLLAGQFNLNLSELRQAANVATSTAATEDPVRDRAWSACRDLVRPRLDSLAQRLEPKATWDDLVMTEEPLNLLRQIAAHVRERSKVYEDWGFSKKMNRGFGINALFAGESGTGKTMGAEVIANELRLNLYRIDLSAVVSKYIGETEKNLRKVFDAAEQGGAILFFDEADALFGKRSEVKDSHDRYANIEINYLLQRMEAFSGLSILATNMKSALDPAFMRRLRFIVNFQFPGPKERKRIWQKSLPPEVPREALDFDRLARLNIAGGNIHSIALNAAFMAAQSATAVTMPVLLTAARTELRKLEKPFNEAEFR